MDSSRGRGGGGRGGGAHRVSRHTRYSQYVYVRVCLYIYIGEEWIHLEAGVEAPTGSVATLEILKSHCPQVLGLF